MDTPIGLRVYRPARPAREPTSDLDLGCDAVKEMVGTLVAVAYRPASEFRDEDWRAVVMTDDGRFEPVSLLSLVVR